MPKRGCGFMSLGSHDCPTSEFSVWCTLSCGLYTDIADIRLWMAETQASRNVPLESSLFTFLILNA